MPDINDMKEALKKWIDVLDDPKVAAGFEGFNKTMQFIFPDIDLKMQLVFRGPKVTIVEGFKEDADMSLTVPSDMFLGITSGEINPMDAFMEGKLKPVGDMSDLEKLEVFMNADLD
jgi:putative sterol carrier protein